jgi:hypothetical protein
MLMAHRLVAEVPLGFSRAEQLRRRPNITSFSFRATRRERSKPDLPFRARRNLEFVMGRLLGSRPFLDEDGEESSQLKD